MATNCRHSSLGPCRIEVGIMALESTDGCQKQYSLPGYSTKMNMDTELQRGLLELSLVQNYVEASFGGRIKVKNRKEVGTRFGNRDTTGKF